jgi:hypothetical protein
VSLKDSTKLAVGERSKIKNCTKKADKWAFGVARLGSVSVEALPAIATTIMKTTLNVSDRLQLQLNPAFAGLQTRCSKAPGDVPGLFRWAPQRTAHALSISGLATAPPHGGGWVSSFCVGRPRRS